MVVCGKAKFPDISQGLLAQHVAILRLNSCRPPESSFPSTTTNHKARAFRLPYDDYDESTVHEHIERLIEAGLLEGKVARASGRSVAHVSRLTWPGHDFLQTNRDDSVWKKAKEQMLKPGASWTVDILKKWAKHEVKQRFDFPEIG